MPNPAIIVEVEGGAVRAVRNIPPGFEVEVWDYDTDYAEEDDELETDDAGEEHYTYLWLPSDGELAADVERGRRERGQ